MGRQIITTIDKRGNCKIDAEGFTGESCKDATKGYEAALAAVSTKSDPKPEMYDDETTSTRETVDNRF